MNAKKTAINAQQVIDYLRQHPDFFVQNEDLLGRLKLHTAPRNSGTASLGERQVALLREQVSGLEQQLQELASVASSNEKLLERWHDLTLGLFSAEDVAEFFSLLEQRLRQDFKADAVCIVLQRGRNLDQELAAVDGLRTAAAGEDKLLSELMELPAPHCGRLTQAKNQLLFAGIDPIATAAVVPLADYGVLAIGSEDEHRFTPGMGVLFLDLLGKTMTWRIQQHARNLRKQA